jgi:hypothetical protein
VLVQTASAPHPVAASALRLHDATHIAHCQSVATNTFLMPMFVTDTDNTAAMQNAMASASPRYTILKINQINL